MLRTIFLTLCLHPLIAIYVGIGALEMALLDLGCGTRYMQWRQGLHEKLIEKIGHRKFSKNVKKYFSPHLVLTFPHCC